MNATLKAISVYGKGSTSLRTERGVEFEIFARVTRSISRENEAGKDAFPRLVQALHSNRHLWTTLALDVADADNKLESSLRAQIFYLAEFVDLHTRRVLKGDATVDALIDINRSVMRGLNVEGGVA